MGKMWIWLFMNKTHEITYNFSKLFNKSSLAKLICIFKNSCQKIKVFDIYTFLLNLKVRFIY
jgi:hypothetical protein